MRKGRTIFLFGLAIFMGIGAAWVANSWVLKRTMPMAEADNTTPVVVAALRIPFGQEIQGAQIKTVAMPNDTVPKGAFNELAEVEGMIAKQAIIPGEIVLKERITKQLEGSTLAAIVTPSKRAATIRVNDEIGVAGFVLPGNRVDVLASRKVKKRMLTETLLQDIKVLAVDQKANPDADEPIVVRAVTLELTPEQAEMLIKAKGEGPLQLTLRNPLDVAKIVKKKKKKTKRKRKLRVTVKPPEPPEPPTVTIIRGTTVDKTRTKL